MATRANSASHATGGSEFHVFSCEWHIGRALFSVYAIVGMENSCYMHDDGAFASSSQMTTDRTLATRTGSRFLRSRSPSHVTSLVQSSRGSAAARSKVHSLMPSWSSPGRSDRLRIAPSGSEHSLFAQLNRRCLESQAGSPTNGFGSMTSPGPRFERRTLPACRSVANNTSVGAFRQLFKELQTFPHQPAVRLPLGVRKRLVAPAPRQRGQWPERVRRGGHTPEPSQQSRNHPILLRFRHRAQRCPRLAALREPDANIIIGVEQSYRQIGIPEAQSLHFVLPLRVRHADLQGCGGVPFESVTGATHAQLTSLSKGRRSQPPPPDEAQSFWPSV